MFDGSVFLVSHICLSTILVQHMCDDEAGDAGCHDTGEPRQHEAVVQDKLPDLCRTGTVKADARQIRRVGRQEEVTIAGRDERQHHDRIHAQIECHRHDDSDGRALRIDQLRGEEENDRIRPWICRNDRAQEGLQDRHMIRKIGIRHPSDTVYRDQRDDPRTEDLAVSDLLRLRLADEENDRRDQEHDDLDDRRHRDRLHLALRISKVREKIREIAQDRDEDDTYKENDGRMIIRRRQLLALQRFILAKDIGSLFRILDHFLERGIILKILASLIADKSRTDDADQSRRDGHRKDLQQVEGVARHRHEAYDGNDSNRYRRCRDPHLGCDGRYRHRTFRADILLDRNIINDREHGVHNMTRAAEDSQEPGRHRRQDRDMFRVVAQEFFRILQHDRQPAGRLQEARAGDDRQNGQHDADRRRARLVVENKRVQRKTDAADDSKPDPPVLNPQEETPEKDNKPQ